MGYDESRYAKLQETGTSSVRAAFPVAFPRAEEVDLIEDNDSASLDDRLIRLLRQLDR